MERNSLGPGRSGVGGRWNMIEEGVPLRKSVMNISDLLLAGQRPSVMKDDMRDEFRGVATTRPIVGLTKI